MRARLSGTLALMGVFAGGAALAAEPNGDPIPAESIFREGRSLVARGDYPHAWPMFAESLRLDHAPGTLLSLADCEEHINRIATAWAHFRELSRELPSTDERQSFAVERAAALELRVPHLTVRSSLLTSGATVWRDDQELDRSSLDIALPVDPGVHTVLVSDGAKVLYRVEVEVNEGQSRVVAAQPARSNEAKSSGAAKRTAAWMTAGVAATALLTGACFGVAALSTNSQAGTHCTGGVCADATSASAYDDARSQARIADVALGIGLVAVAAAGYLFLTSRPSDAQPTSSAKRVSIALGRVAW
jgi:hypothetical protein